MIVNHNNIQRWIFDYFEGNLSLHEQIELREFIKRNPEYKDDFEDWENVRLTEDTVPIYANAEALMVKESMLSRKVWAIAGVLILLLGSSLIYWSSSTWVSKSNNAVATPKVSPPLKSVDSDLAMGESSILSSLNGGSNNGETSWSNTNEMAAPSKSIILGEGSVQMVSTRIDKPFVNSTAETDMESNTPLNPIILKPFVNQMNRVDETENVNSARNGGVISSIVGLSDNLDHCSWMLINQLTIDSDYDCGELELIGNQEEKTEKDRKGVIKQLDRLFARKIGLTNLSDPIFINDGGNALNSNTALFGAMGSSRINLTYRNQWHGTGNASARYGVSYDQFVEQLQGGIGFDIEKLDYEKGMYSGYSAKFGYAPRFNLTRLVSLTVAAAFHVNQLEVNFDNYRYNSQVELTQGDVNDTYESGYVPRTNKILNKDLSMGVMLNTPFCYIGGSAEHLMEPGQNLFTSDMDENYTLKTKYSVQIGTDYKKNSASKLVFSPQLIFENQGGKSEFWASSSFRFNNLIAGTGVSTNKSVKGIVGIQSKNLRFMYSYDLTKSELLQQMKGSHEASIRVLFNSKKKKSPLAFL